MRPNLDELAPELPSLVDLAITDLLVNARLPGKRRMRRVWRLV